MDIALPATIFVGFHVLLAHMNQVINIVYVNFIAVNNIDFLVTSPMSNKLPTNIRQFICLIFNKFPTNIRDGIKVISACL